MSDTLKALIIVGILLFVGVFAFQYKNPPEIIRDTSVKSGDYVPIPSIGTNEEYENYAKTFKTYKSDIGFSFKYPPHLKVKTEQDTSTNRIVLTPINANTSEGLSAIIISIAENNQGMTAEEWLLSPTSGFKHSDKYFKTTIDGQEAVYTDGGMWTVVNTPDNKYRLSIADLVTGSADELFTEMGIVVDSLIFNP